MLHLGKLQPCCQVSGITENNSEPNTLAFFAAALVMKKKIFYKIGTEGCTINFFTSVNNFAP